MACVGARGPFHAWQSPGVRRGELSRSIRWALVLWPFFAPGEVISFRMEGGEPLCVPNPHDSFRLQVALTELGATDPVASPAHP